ncbi:MAG: hypothetical protein FJ245_08070 [Nitrospira sp.]|nr:hypothetical protein [Nitrospira sp.]
MPWLMLYFAFAFPIMLLLAVLILEQWQKRPEQRSAPTGCPREDHAADSAGVAVGGGTSEPSGTVEAALAGGRQGGRLTIQGFG